MKKYYRPGDPVVSVARGRYYGTRGRVVRLSQIQYGSGGPLFDVLFDGIGVRRMRWSWIDGRPEEQKTDGKTSDDSGPTVWGKS